MTKNERLKHLRKNLLRLSQGEFAEKIGVSHNAISQYEKGDNWPREAQYEKMLSVYYINRAWLEDGIGDPFVDKSTFLTDEGAFRNDIVLSGPEAKVAGFADDLETIMLPEMDARAIASFGENIYGNMYKLTTQKKWPVKKMPGRNYDRAIIIDITGDSMWPYFRDGMKVVAREVLSGKWGYVTGIHAVSTRAGTFTLKRISSNNGKAITLQATNPAYDEVLTVAIGDILCMFSIGEVVYAPPVQDI